MCVAVGAVDVWARAVRGREPLAFVAVFVVFVFGAGLSAFSASRVDCGTVLRIVINLPTLLALRKFRDVLPEFDAGPGAIHVERFCEECRDDRVGFVDEREGYGGSAFVLESVRGEDPSCRLGDLNVLEYRVQLKGRVDLLIGAGNEVVVFQRDVVH
jgi:hypothetical protein